ncbi:MAG: hypothetical protein Q9172_003625 [Xanthocarpia lactea]
MLLITVVTLAAAVSAAPSNYPITNVFPLADGFPNPSPEQLLSIQKAAGGSLPNAPLPTTLSQNETTALKLLAHNELFEVAFFNELLTNITTNVPGYCVNDTAPLDRALLIKSIEAIKNQEELHAIGANAFLVNAKEAPIAPCQYIFPVSNFKNAILFAQVFTDLALGTIPAVQLLFGTDGGEGRRNVIALGSILGQEGQQDGFFRYAQRKTPSAAPFLTGGTASIAFNVLRKLIVQDSCPQPLSTIDLPVWGNPSWEQGGLWANGYVDKALRLPEPAWPLWISINPKLSAWGSLPFTEFGLDVGYDQSIVYLSGQNLPVVVPVGNISHVLSAPYTDFEALFPFEEAGFANGLTIAVLVNGKGPFANADEVANAVVDGPVIIERN